MTNESILEQQHLQYHLELLKAFIAQIEQQPPFHGEEAEEKDTLFLDNLKMLGNDPHTNPNFLYEGQELMCRIITTYPHLTPLLYRDLLWFFGGDCLHFMPDEEIACYQSLDEQRHDAAISGGKFSYKDERAKIFGLH
jgi:hypothetical protein